MREIIIDADATYNPHPQELIRCKDCREYDCGFCKYMYATVLPDWFCWNAQKKEGILNEQ